MKDRGPGPTAPAGSRDGVPGLSASIRDAGPDGPGAFVSFPFDRATVERFRQDFPRARWREADQHWFVPGERAEARLHAWFARKSATPGAFDDARGRDDFALDPIHSPYLEAAEDLVIRTPFSRTVVALLREVPWAQWDREAGAWRVPFRSAAALRAVWPEIETAARRAEPDERRKRARERRGTPEDAERRREDGEKRRHRYPVPDTAPPPQEQVLMTHAGCVVFTAVSGELVPAETAERFYPEVATTGATLIWADWRRATRDELVRAWPSRAEPEAAERGRGWWTPTLPVLREERRRAASLERASATRAERAGTTPDESTA